MSDETENKQLPLLYGIDSQGRLKFWSVRVEGAEIVVSYGLVGGKTTEQRPKAKIVGKNIGRSNETTAEEQAQLEAESKWKKQIDKNYHIDPKNTTPLENPMLAHDYRKQGHRITEPCFIQPKLDGVRCLVKYCKDTSRVILKSRGNKEYPMLSHLEDDLGELLVMLGGIYNQDVYLDGELYFHGESLQILSLLLKNIQISKGM